jgi:hypothetical protein
MTGNADMIDIVHRGTADSAIIPFETHGLDQVDSGSQTGTETQNSADISGDLRLEEGNAHSG